MSTNPFNSPHVYRRQILSSNLLSNLKMDDYSGKGILYLFLTRFCGVGCPFCFFRSKPEYRKDNIEDRFSASGVRKLIDFSNRANLGYTMISGGGEPMNEKESVLQLVEHVQSDRIVIATSGVWASNRRVAIKYLDDLAAALKRRKSPTKLVVRISISEGHAIKLGEKPAINLIDLFREKYRHIPNLFFQIHAFENDSQLEKVLNNFPDHSLEYVGENITDNEIVYKAIPYKYQLSFGDDYKIVVGVSRIFQSNLDVNLCDENQFIAGSKVFDLDLIHSEGNNSATTSCLDGTKGIDWAVNYNGNVYTWQNQVNDNLHNLYEDDFDKVWSETNNDPIMAGYIENGRNYRESIVAEVNPRAVKRTKGIAIRDFSGSIIFEEWKDRLYFSIRVLQDFLATNKISSDDVRLWPSEIRDLVFLDQSKLQDLYKESSFCIFDQYKLKPDFIEDDWKDLFMLVLRGHFDVTLEQIQSAITFFNKHAKVKISTLTEVSATPENLVRRLTERYMHIKHTLSQSSSLNLSVERGECSFKTGGYVEGRK